MRRLIKTTITICPLVVLIGLSGCSSSTPAQKSTSPVPAVSSPAATASPLKANTMTIETSAGTVVATLDQKAPQTLQSFANLAAKNYFDNTVCHRLTTQGIYVLQCGDPTGTGRGGPGYKIPDENLPTNGTGVYPAGTLAMANSGPNTNGSQFFIVYQDSPLPPSYTVFGKITSGLDNVLAVAKKGTADGSGDGAPIVPVTIKKVTVS